MRVCDCVGFVMYGFCNVWARVYVWMYCNMYTTTLSAVFPCFFFSCKTNARLKLAKLGHGPHSSKLVVICVVLLLFVLFYVLFVYKCVYCTTATGC